MSMKDSYKKALYQALTNAEEMIRGHVEIGYDPTDEGDKSFTLEQYKKACYRVAKKLSKEANKVKPIS